MWARPAAAQEQSLTFVPETTAPAPTNSLAQTFVHTFRTRFNRHMERVFLERYHMTSLSSAYLFQIEFEAEKTPNLYYAEPIRDAILDAMGHALREHTLYRRVEDTYRKFKNLARVSGGKQGSSVLLYGPSLNPEDKVPQTFDMKATMKLVGEELFFTVDSGSLETRLVVDLLNTEEGSFTVMKHVSRSWHLGLNNSWDEERFEALGQVEYRF